MRTMVSKERAGFYLRWHYAPCGLSTPRCPLNRRITVCHQRQGYLVGAYELAAKAPNHSVAQLHAEIAKEIEDAGLSGTTSRLLLRGRRTGRQRRSMANYLTDELKHVDSTDMGGTS